MIRHTAIRVCRSFYSAQPQLCSGNLTAPTKIALATAQPISDGENRNIFPSTLLNTRTCRYNKKTIGESPSALGNSPSPSFSIDWSVAFDGASAIPFTEKASNVLLAPVNSDDIEIKPDGLLYLPEIKYRRILNKAFGPGNQLP
jgi:hypothetical protein